MPSTIPYDPSLALGNIVVPEVLDNLTKIAALQAPVDAAQDTLNSFLSMKRSLKMTMAEMSNLNIDQKPLQAKMLAVDTAIEKAATDYVVERAQEPGESD
jgi:hypothetical protein